MVARNRALADATLGWWRWLSCHVEGRGRAVFESAIPPGLVPRQTPARRPRNRHAQGPGPLAKAPEQPAYCPWPRGP